MCIVSLAFIFGKKGLNYKMEEGICKYSYASLYCPNCGKLNSGHRNCEGIFKIECVKCQVMIIDVQNSRRHNTINIFAQKGQVYIG